MNTIKALQQLGFTEYEARAYTTLVTEGELNGYGLAKKTGIPRANIYAVIEKLVEHGAVLRAEHEGSRRYTPIPPTQLLDILESEHKQALAAADQALTHQVRKPEPAPVFNLRGAEVLSKCRHMIDLCRTSLWIALQPHEAAELSDTLHRAAERGVHITTLCLQACEHECGGCQGTIHRHAIAPPDDHHRLVLVVDQTSALIGQAGDAFAEGVVTQQALVVELATAFIRQNLALAALNQAHGSLTELLPPPVLERLNILYPDGGFPAYLQALGAEQSD